MKYILEYTSADLEPTDSFTIKQELNPDVWDGYDLKEDIHEKLLEIANEFTNSLYGDFTVYDIVLTGSLASFNWSKYSDFDIHIQIDYKDINEDTELVEMYLDLTCKKWNKEFDVLIYDYEVELFVEDKSVERPHINGLYSILKNKWVKRPTPTGHKDVDVNTIEKKAIAIMEQVDELEKSLESGEDVKEEVDKVWDKVKKGRRDGIASPDGEYSIGNLVFKYLRRNEYIGKIILLKKQFVEQKYSI